MAGSYRSGGGSLPLAISGLGVSPRPPIPARRGPKSMFAPSTPGGDDGVRLVRALQARPQLGVEAALVAARALGLEGGVDQPVLLGLEGADLLLAARDDGQRGRLHTPERDGAVERGA